MNSKTQFMRRRDNCRSRRSEEDAQRQEIERECDKEHEELRQKAQELIDQERERRQQQEDEEFLKYTDLKGKARRTSKQEQEAIFDSYRRGEVSDSGYHQSADELR